MKLWLMKCGGSYLKPADEESAAVVNRMEVAEAAEFTIRRVRNPKFHNKGMGLIRLVFKNQEQYTDFDKFRRALTIEAGHFEDLRLLDGTTQREAKSLAWGNMDDDEFSAVYDSVLDTIMTVVLPGIDRPELEAQVEQFLWQ